MDKINIEVTIWDDLKVMDLTDIDINACIDLKSMV
jgi:hypothetical protein